MIIIIIWQVPGTFSAEIGFGLLAMPSQMIGGDHHE